MEPIRVTFKLTGEVALSGYPLHLDALIAYAVTQYSLRQGTNESRIRALADELPLERVEKDGQWVWAASALEKTEVLRHGIRGWTRTTNREEMAMDHGPIIRYGGKPRPFKQQIKTDSGQFRNYMGFQPVQWVTTMTAWCLGDAEAIESLLSPEAGLLKHIGKLRRTGLGRILEVWVEEDESARENWKRRILPWREDGYEPIDAVAQPPYWDTSKRVTAWVPIEIL